jgi:hypothetical protein
VIKGYQTVSRNQTLTETSLVGTLRDGSYFAVFRASRWQPAAMLPDMTDQSLKSRGAPPAQSFET